MNGERDWWSERGIGLRWMKERREMRWTDESSNICKAKVLKWIR